MEDSCNAAYTVDFGDGTAGSLTISEKILSHSYTSPGNYDIVVSSGSAPAGCKSAKKSVEVRDPILNVVRIKKKLLGIENLKYSNRVPRENTLIFHSTGPVALGDHMPCR